MRSAATAKSPSDLGNEPNILVQGIDSYDLQTGKFKVDIILNNVKADAGTWGLTFDTEILKNGKFVKEGVIESLLGDEASYAVNNGFHTYRWYAVNGEVDGTVLNEN